MKPSLLTISTILTLAAGTAVALGQFTPGVGGPVVPGPTGPVAPVGPSAPYPYQPSAVPVYQPSTPGASPVYQPSGEPGIRIGEPSPVPPPVYVPRLSEQQLADLTASIALYPDPLIAEMFPAAVSIEELAYADRWIEQHPGADEVSIASLPVADAVRDMIHYPTVLNLMTDHLDWTQSLALAFTYQRQELFDAIQRWRALAVANGYLYSSAQLDVLSQGQVILIQPPRATAVVYVPVYDPQVIFVRTRPINPPRNLITFGNAGFSLSFAFNDLDWHDHEIRVPRHEDRWDAHPDHITAPPPPRTGDGRGDGRGGPDVRGDARVVFVPNSGKPNEKPAVVYPTKVVTPVDKKVITLPPSSGAPGRGPSGNGAPGRGGNPNDRGNPGNPGNPGR